MLVNVLSPSGKHAHEKYTPLNPHFYIEKIGVLQGFPKYRLSVLIRPRGDSNEYHNLCFEQN